MSDGAGVDDRHLYPIARTIGPYYPTEPPAPGALRPAQRRGGAAGGEPGEEVAREVETGVEPGPVIGQIE